MNEKFSDERISAYLDDELSPDARAEVEREMAESAELRQAVEELRALRVGLQSLPRYRLETNIAERVLQLAEREVLLGGRTDDAPDAPTTRTATASGATSGTRPAFDAPQPPSLRAGAPAYGSVSSPSSPREGRFSWRTLGWSAAAAVMAALVTNYYHTTNLSTDRAADRVAMSETEAKSTLHAAKKMEAGRPASDGEPTDRLQSRHNEEPDAAALSKAAPADVPAANVEMMYPPQTAVANADSIDDRPTADALADAARARSVERGGLEGSKPDSDVDPTLDAANAGRAAGAGRGFAGESAKDTAMNAAFAGLGAMAGGFGGEGETWIVYLEVSPDAWQAREFEKLLEDNHVVLVDEAEAAEADDAYGAAGAIKQRSAQDKPNESTLAHAAPRPERPAANSAARRAKAATPESDVLVVDLPAERLDRLLADFERRRGDFAVKTAFDVDLFRSEIVAGGVGLGGGNAPASSAAAERALTEAEGKLESTRPSAPPPAAPSITRRALDATDAAGSAKGESVVAPRPRDFGSRGGPERKTSRAALAPGVGDAPNAAAPAEKGRGRATGGQAQSAESRSVESQRENKQGEDNPARATVEAPRATEPGDAPVEAPKESQSPPEARLEREAARIVPEGYARRVLPREDLEFPRAAGTLRQSQAENGPTFGPHDLGVAAAPAPSAPRVRVYFLLRPAARGPASARLAAPADKSGAAPPPADSATTTETPAAEAPAAPAKPQ